MKSITEHLKNLPEPYSTLALRRVVKGHENLKFESLRKALLSSALPWGEGQEHEFWNAVDNFVVGFCKDLPEIPAFLLAELEPAPAAPACVFEVGKVYSRRDGEKRKIVAIDDHPDMPLIMVDMLPNGERPGSEFSRRRLDGRISAIQESKADLIPPAPPKRVVPLECSDVPPGTVWRSSSSPNDGWAILVAVGKNGPTLLNVHNELEDYTWESLKESGDEILLPGTTVWRKCQKEVDA